jgi:hypothetical protein
MSTEFEIVMLDENSNRVNSDSYNVNDLLRAKHRLELLEEQKQAKLNNDNKCKEIIRLKANSIELLAQLEEAELKVSKLNEEIILVKKQISNNVTELNHNSWCICILCFMLIMIIVILVGSSTVYLLEKNISDY